MERNQLGVEVIRQSEVNRETGRCREISTGRQLAIFIMTVLCGTVCGDEPAVTAKFLRQYCTECHSGDSPEANLRLDNLNTLGLDARLTLLNRAQEQLFVGLMPPADSKQPSDVERAGLVESMSKQLRQHNAAVLDDKLRRPEFGNYVDHDALFSGRYADQPGFTYDRRWLISEFIFDARVNHLIDHPQYRTIDGVRQQVIGDNGVGLGTRFGGQSLRQRITNPFLLSSSIGVRYYSHDALTGGHLLTMISNAKKIAAHMASETTMKAHYPAMFRIMQMELSHRQVLRSREQFLTDHVERLLQDVFGERHAALLPDFVRTKVDDPPPHVDGKGNPIKKTNLGLLARYDKQDLEAIWLGINRYRADGVSDEEVIERCERDWFFFGVHPKRIASRISIMKVLNQHWDRSLIDADIRKKNPRPPRFVSPGEQELETIRQAVRTQRQPGDRFQQVIDKCMALWTSEFKLQREAAGVANDAQLKDLITELYVRILERSPDEAEVHENLQLMRSYVAKLNVQAAIAKLAESFLLSSELVYRSEFGSGEPDEFGRRMMSPRDASYAISYALTDSSPDNELAAAADEGRLKTREDYRREILRLLHKRDQYYVIDERIQKGNFNASVTNQPVRKLRFFREFFGYPRAMDVFKDDVRFGAGRHEQMVSRLIDEADLLVGHILQNDTHVFEELLTTDKFYVYHSGDNEAMTAAAARQKEIYEYFRKFDWRNFSEEELFEHWPFIDRMKIRGTVFANFLNDERRRSGWIRSFQRQMEALEQSLGNGQEFPVPYDIVNMHYSHRGNATGRTGQVMRGHEVTTYFNLDFRTWDYPAIQPAAIPNRRGMLTHPAWLIAHSLNTETDPVRRGKWIREKLLAGTIPDVPITVDAVVPEDHHKTLRQRLEKATSSDYCWKCHQRMNPLGLPFESFDDFGRFRTDERIEHEENLITAQKSAPRVDGIQVAVYRTLPVDSQGVLEGTGDPELDGEVRDAFDLTERLSKSDRVRQSFIRHAFRYFMGRNETLSDSRTLMDADQAYLNSSGSFDAVIVSLLTSDSFIYRMRQ